MSDSVLEIHIDTSDNNTEHGQDEANKRSSTMREVWAVKSVFVLHNDPLQSLLVIPVLLHYSTKQYSTVQYRTVQY